MIPQPILTFIIERLLAPLAVEVIIQFLRRRDTDPAFKAKTDQLFFDIARATNQEEFKADAKDLQSAIHS